jgi:hypothetical protein
MNKNQKNEAEREGEKITKSKRELKSKENKTDE